MSLSTMLQCLIATTNLVGFAACATVQCTIVAGIASLLFAPKMCSNLFVSFVAARRCVCTSVHMWRAHHNSFVPEGHENFCTATDKRSLFSKPCHHA